MVGRSGTILGISPGTRTVGIAVIEEGILLDWQVKTFSGKYSPVKLRIICAAVVQVVERYSISHIAIKQADLVRTSRGIEEVAAHVASLTEKRNIPVRCYSLDQLKAFHAPGNTIPKSVLMDILTQRYPMLCGEYQKERRSAHKYYSKLFEAVAVADMYGEDTYE